MPRVLASLQVRSGFGPAHGVCERTLQDQGVEAFFERNDGCFGGLSYCDGVPLGWDDQA